MEIGVYHEFHCRPEQTAAAAFEEALSIRGRKDLTEGVARNAEANCGLGITGHALIAC